MPTIPTPLNFIGDDIDEVDDNDGGDGDDGGDGGDGGHLFAPRQGKDGDDVARQSGNKEGNATAKAK